MIKIRHFCELSLALPTGHLFDYKNKKPARLAGLRENLAEE
jgi:hypothetical protein